MEKCQWAIRRWQTTSKLCRLDTRMMRGRDGGGGQDRPRHSGRCGGGEWSAREGQPQQDSDQETHRKAPSPLVSDDSADSFVLQVPRSAGKQHGALAQRSDVSCLSKERVRLQAMTEETANLRKRARTMSLTAFQVLQHSPKCLILDLHRRRRRACRSRVRRKGGWSAHAPSSEGTSAHKATMAA